MNESADRPKKKTSGFAPADTTDGRERGNWESRYNKSAWIQINIEGGYLFILLLISFVFLYLSWVGLIGGILELPIEEYSAIKIFIYGCLGGLIGGILNGMKWLYHSVAKGFWNQDRIVWRLLTPFLSLGLALAIIALIKSGLFSAFNSSSVESPTTSFSIGFLVGLFSDSAMAKLAEFAQTFFGVTSKKEST